MDYRKRKLKLWRVLDNDRFTDHYRHYYTLGCVVEIKKTQDCISDYFAGCVGISDLDCRPSR